MKTNHILAADQFDQTIINDLFEKAAYFKKELEKGTVFHDLDGKVMAALFYEPSSRTFSSHAAAMQRLGGSVFSIQDTNTSSISKGETLEDTIRVFSSYADVIVLRHNQEGAAKQAASVSTVPVINAGDGTGEHPTQALLDLFTIHEKFNRLDNLSIAMIGDLKYGRTVHSLSKLLSLYKDITITYVNPETSPMPDDIVSTVTGRGVTVKNASSLDEIMSDIDVLYMTRVQKERMEEKLYNEIKDMFVLTNDLANKMKHDAIIMHPLPRINEIEKDVDANPRAVYFSHQVKNGMFVRMAVLSYILSS